ncbi:MAG: cytochrome c [Nitrospinota bacterium]|nr:MAG: cytochrome c [Nitrospinota bacterium]
MVRKEVRTMLSWRGHLLLILAFTLVGLLVLPGYSRGEAKDAVIAQGKTLFLQSCSACHGPDAKGLPHLGKNLRASAFVKGLSDAELLAFIKKGRPSFDPANTTHVDMPPKGGNPALTDEQLQAIIAYIRSIAE